jgi:hypothetical protein
MKSKDLINSLLIYKFPVIDKLSSLSESDFIFDVNPSPKLIKYGFNRIIETLDMTALTSNPYYKSGLNFDFDRTDKDSISSKCKKTFQIKITNVRLFCICWEIFSLFGFLNQKKVILTTDKNVIEEVEAAAKKIFKLTSKFEYIKEKDKTLTDLVFQTYAQMDLDENTNIHLLMNDLPMLLSKQKVGSAMIVQLFGIHTQIIVEIIYYLSSIYQESYIFKPSVISDLSNEKYLVLIGLKSVIKLVYPPLKQNTYLNKIIVDMPPDIFVNTIQCINSELIPNKIITFNLIKKYLNSNVFEGLTHDELIDKQNVLSDQWISIFTDKGKLELVLDKKLSESSVECDHSAELMNLYALI